MFLKRCVKMKKGITAVSLIDKAIAALSAVSDRIEDSAQVIENLTEINLSLTDIAHRVNAQTIELTGVSLETMLTKIETRLALIEKLQQKYGTTIKVYIGISQQSSAAARSNLRGAG